MNLVVETNHEKFQEGSHVKILSVMYKVSYVNNSNNNKFKNVH